MQTKVPSTNVTTQVE